LVARLLPFFAWTDGLAVLYGNRYRSAFTFNFLVAACAVGLALLSVALGLHGDDRFEIVCTGLELAAISVVLFLARLGRRR